MNNPPRLHNSRYKEDIYKSKKQREKEANPNRKGAAFETAVAAELQKTSKKPVRRNHQGREGGGLGNPDISALDGWHFEVKDEETIRMPAYHKQVKKDCPPNNKPGIIYRGPVDGEPWVSIQLKKRMNFASDLIEAAGGEIVFP